MNIKFKIATPEKVVYENEIEQVSVPTMDGEITILPNHIPLVSVLKAGELRIKDKNGEQIMAVSGGFLEMRGNNELIWQIMLSVPSILILIVPKKLENAPKQKWRRQRLVKMLISHVYKR